MEEHKFGSDKNRARRERTKEVRGERKRRKDKADKEHNGKYKGSV